MKKKFYQGLCLLLSLLLAGFQAACNLWELVNWDNPSAIYTTGLSDKFCFDYLVLSDQYNIFCNKESSPEEANFSGLLTNEGEGYAHDVSLTIIFGLSSQSGPSCQFTFDEIGPGASVPLLCQVKVGECSDKLPAKIEVGSCNYMTYTGHLDWLAAQDATEPPEPEETKEEGEYGGYTLTEEDRDLIQKQWIWAFEEYPCEPEKAEQAFLDWLNGQAIVWDAMMGGVVCDGCMFSTQEKFEDYLIGFSGVINERLSITKTWKGTFELTTVATVNCGACVPPGFTGTIEFRMPLDTCAITGEIKGSGAGATVYAACDKPNPLPCTGTGSYSVGSSFYGTVDSAGNLSIDDTTGFFKGSVTWEGSGCTKGTGTINNSTFERSFTITGSLDWSGAASGKIMDTSNKICAHSGTWTAQLVENP